MLERAIASKLSSLAKQFPVISITGPRQAGKTTLVKMFFSGHDYVSLEDPDERGFAHSDPKGFLRRFDGRSVILDEIQRAPELLSYIQGIVDNEALPGRFVLTGSQQFQFMSKITQTLAGRTAVVYLLPFSLSELMKARIPDPYKIVELPDSGNKPSDSLENLIYKGMYPRIHDKGLEPHDWLQSYFATYVERDVREIVNVGDLETFRRFVRLCAARSGQLINFSSLSLDAGISHTTARNWLSVLQASFVLHLLPPHHANFSKRIIKSSKLYFMDTGLLCYLLRIKSPGDITMHPMKGAIFETFVLSELYKAFTNLGETPPLFFWRDRTGHEVDIVIDAANMLIPVEIKSGETVAASFFEGLNYFISLGAPAATTGVLVHGGEAMYKRDGITVRPWYCCV
jgi:predicted AAA+ superfamily ATPase